ncbi:MAG: ATP-binding protein [Bacteroidales bacterium]|nr:ATP-binding protein [Bacteroidales bacterium]
MGRFINIGNSRFRRAVADIYVDKTPLIAAVNKTLFTEGNMSCVTRCRRFGKSMAATMLRAYYDKSCDSRDLFRGLKIEQDPNFEKHLNKYPVIYIDMTNIITKYGHTSDIVELLKRDLLDDLMATYPEVELGPHDDVMDFMMSVAEYTGEPFFMIIDEWDAICREFMDSKVVIDRYIDLLRRFFKGSDADSTFIGAYITGILPIKKYNTQSALNNFWEYSMTAPGGWEKHFGFTAQEVKALCEKYDIDFDEMEKWYDGYRIGNEPSMFNPNSVMQAIKKREFANYWNSTGAFENVVEYIQMNFDGLKEDVVKMLAGGRCKVNYTSFNNDLKSIDSRDNVLTVLIHLGYLSYDTTEGECYIPNKEVREELRNAVEKTNWKETIDALQASESLLKSVYDGEEETVAAGVELVHQRCVSIINYNKEEALSHVVSLAFYTAQNDYDIYRELPAGKGFADLVFIPRPNVARPALLVELKWDKDVQTAINQIRERNYPDVLRSHVNNTIIVGINYDPDSKQHTCKIEHA